MKSVNEAIHNQHLRTEILNIMNPTIITRPVFKPGDPTSNRYGLPLIAPVSQTIIPVMNESGLVYGFFAIASTTFTGLEASYLVGPTILPLRSVTVGSNPANVRQFMAAVYSRNIVGNYRPWASSSFQDVMADGAYRGFTMSAMDWITRFSKGIVVAALSESMNRVQVAPVAPTAPVVSTTATQTWASSVSYLSLNGACSFIDFNWQILFNAQSSVRGLRIVPISNPPAIFRSSVVGVPVVQNGGGVVYDTIRILKIDEATPGVYVFLFDVYNIDGLKTAVTLNLTVV